jgi:hypothetical protein
MVTKLRNHLRSALQRRYDTSGKSEIERYYGEQMAYGHREVLLKYIGLNNNHYFKASITHGKILPDRLDPIIPQFTQDGSQILQVLWRSDVETEAAKKGVNAISIGATGLYALENMGQSIEETKQNISHFAENHKWNNDHEEGINLMEGRKVLYMPLHSWEGDVVNQINSDIGLLKTLNPKNVTVLLGFLDFLDPTSRRYFESFGFKTECAGIRASKVFGSPAGGRETFLYSLFDLISRNDYVIANGLTTGLLYATCLNKHVGILPNVTLPSTKFSSWRNDRDFVADMSLQRSFFVWLNTNTGETDKLKIQSDIYDALGISKFKTSAQLLQSLPLILKGH